MVSENFKEQNLAIALPKRVWDHMVLLENIQLEFLENRLLEKHICELLLHSVLSPTNVNLRAYVVSPVRHPVPLHVLNLLGIAFKMC